jgi:hypothetical protein
MDVQLPNIGQVESIEFKVKNRDGSIKEHFRINPDGSQVDLMEA